jgi:hypothetical protein
MIRYICDRCDGIIGTGEGKFLIKWSVAPTNKDPDFPKVHVVVQVGTPEELIYHYCPSCVLHFVQMALGLKKKKGGKK